jgi:hexosaminidase
VGDLGEAHPQLSTDESYNLSVPSAGGVAVASSRTVFGALRALETFSQLVRFDFDRGAYVVSGAPWTIQDQPRFPHRGLMVDSGRHFLPLPSIRQIIDTLPYAKLNVLHWHIVDMQSFPFQSRSSPKLWEGSFSPMERYTQGDVKSIVEYARLRGVRVMVEFDVPGHAASWCAGYPEICPAADCQMPLNVASEATFNLIEGLISEVAGTGSSKTRGASGLFPDSFVHLGGDEVDTTCWTKTPSVASWLQKRNLTADEGYAYFVKRVAGMAIERGHRPVQWSEVYDHFRASLPKETIVHIWKGVTNVTEVVANGYDVLRNVGYNNVSWYLDNLDVKWDAVSQNDPCEGIPSDELCARVLGGHGEMWGETVDGSDLQSTVWPRQAAIAEKLWSDRSQTEDVAGALPRIRDFRCLLLQRGVAAAPVDNAKAREAPAGPGSCFAEGAGAVPAALPAGETPILL